MSYFDFPNTPIESDITLKAKWCGCDGSVPIDPSNPTLAMLPSVLALDDPLGTFPLNTSIPDTCNGVENPWKIGHYGVGYGTAKKGFYLYREFIQPLAAEVRWNPSDNYPDYGSSNIKNWLETTYPTWCSQDILDLVETLQVPYVGYTGSSYKNGKTVSAKFFLMSPIEMYGAVSVGTSNSQTIPWDGWKQRTGLSSPNGSANAGRVGKTPDGYTGVQWTRDAYYTPNLYDISAIGNVGNGWRPSYDQTGQKLGYRIACFVAEK